MRQRINGLCEHGKDLCAICAKNETEAMMRTLNAKMKAASDDIWRKLILREAKAIQRQKQ